ncbi:MAG TPA: hypothetical protein PLD23_03805 [Armatimonadota bacterium]|nr:hypothetical protein [Armatimonadota bacterium]
MRTAGWAVVAAIVTASVAGAARTGPDAPLIAVLREAGLPSAARADGLLRAFRHGGMRAEPISYAEACDPAVLSAARVRLLVVPDSPHFPAAAAEALLRYLRSGGHVALLGGRAFSDPAVWVGRQWLSQSDLARRRAETPVQHMLFDFEPGDAAQWQRNTNKPEPASRALDVEGPHGDALLLELNGMGPWQWDAFGADLAAAPPPGHNVVCLWAKGGPTTRQAALEIDERDGSRWVATVDTPEQWTRQVVRAADFRFLADGSPAGRGGDGDSLRLDEGTRLSLGLATGLTNHPDGDHRVWVAEIGTATSDLPDPPGVELPLDAFSDYEPYVLRDVTGVRPWAGQAIVRCSPAGRCAASGLSAVGFALARKSEFSPLLECVDEYGRGRGWALGMLTHYEGDYRGGSWLLSGVTTPEFYETPAFQAAIVESATALLSRDLASEARQRDEASRATQIRLTTPAPHAFVRLSADRRRFVTPDGKPLFLTGCNYANHFDRQFHWGWAFDAARVEADFRRAKAAGHNAFRLWSGALGGPDEVEAIRELARRYGIYLIIHCGAGGTMEQITESVRSTAEAWRDEPMVIGYDLMNEPYVETVGAITSGGRLSPIVELRPSARFAGMLDPSWVEQCVRQPPSWPPMPGGLSDDVRRELYVAGLLWGRVISGRTAGGADYSTLTGADGLIRAQGDLADLVTAVDRTFARWIGAQVDAIRSVDSNHLITVGYNTALACLPANGTLDFVCHHIYQPPTSYQDIVKNATALDRLATVWPDRPVMLGEFGYSNGVRLGESCLDWHASSVGEMTVYLAAMAHGHAGALKWLLDEWPEAVMRDNAGWMSPDNAYEQRFGSFAYDGTPEMKPKPIAYALRFLREYIDHEGTGGELTITRSRTATGAGYVFRAQRALFVGDRRAELPGLEFASRSGGPANVMLAWGTDSLRLMCDADVDVKLRPALFAGGLGVGARVSGRHGGMRIVGPAIEIRALEGETVELR